MKAGADLEARDADGLTALEVSLLKGWQRVSYLLLENNASRSGVAAIKARGSGRAVVRESNDFPRVRAESAGPAPHLPQGKITCPDCKRVVMEYKL